MKATSLLLLILVFITASAQDGLKNNCFNLSHTEMKWCMEQILVIAGNYQLQKVDSSDKHTVIYFYSNDQKEELNFRFEVKTVGTDADLKIQGEKTYSLRGIFGQYIILDKIYSGYLGRNYDQTTVRRSGRDKWKTKDSHTIDFTRYDSSGYWIIRLF